MTADTGKPRYFNVKDFGAAGDGITDDTTAIQAAIAAAMSYTTAGEPVLRLFSAELLSKWGFNDGDAPDEWLDWCDEHEISYGNWRGQILPALVRRYLLPVLDQRVEVVQIGCNHNSVRAAAVDGVDVSGHWYDSGFELSLTPEYVEVTMKQILEVARAGDGEHGVTP